MMHTRFKFSTCVVLLLFCILMNENILSCNGKKIPRWWMKVAQRQGPNACVVEELPGTGKEFWTECKYWLNRKICGRKTIARFECCEGFEQIEGENGCTRVKPLLNLLETAESLGATRWAAYIRESGLANELETAGAYTLFAPTNEAFDNIHPTLRSQLDSYRGNPSNPILQYHILPTKLDSDDFQANLVLETKYPGNFLRVNKYSNGMNTINCALLLRKDQQATNGIVHIIDSVLDPSKSLPDNVADMVLRDGRFSVLSEMLEKSGYINVLRTMQGSVTFLAPSDEAFQKLSDSRREKIINDREARLALIQNHIIPHVICDSAITGEHRVGTVSNNKLTFNCDVDGAYVESTKLRSNFNLGKNGIVHMLDDVLLPDRAKNLVELAESRQLMTFVELVRNAGLEETLSHTGDYTFFVPDESAWFELDPAVLQRARNDVEFAGLMLRFHGSYGRHLTNSITDNQAIMSLDEENPLRLQVWRRALGVEDARITEPDIEAQNGVIHIINKVIFPSNQTVASTLRSLPGSDTFHTYEDLLQQTLSKSPPVLSLGPGEDSFYTFFVPTDQAFGRMNANERSALRSGGTEAASSFIKKHVAVNMFPYTSFEPNLIYSIDGMDGANFNLRKNGDGQLSANGVNVKSSLMSANGVIHIIDEVFEVTGMTYYNRPGSSSSSSEAQYSYGGGLMGEGSSESYEGRLDRGSGGTGSYRTSHSSSSSSSASGGATTRTRTTYKKTVTFAEGYNDLDNLPTFPQGSELKSRQPELVPSPVISSPASSPKITHDESLDGETPVPTPETVDQSDNNARLHGYNTVRRYSHRSHSFSRSAGSGSPTDNEPGRQILRSNERQRGIDGNQSNEHEIDNDIETETRERLERARLEEIRRQTEIRIEEEERRQRELEEERMRLEEIRIEEERRIEEIRLEEERKRKELEEERQRLEDIRIKEEERMRLEEIRIEEERKLEEIRLEEERRQRELEEERQEIIRVRQQELQQQQTENTRIEEENRLREIENRIHQEIHHTVEENRFEGRHSSRRTNTYNRPPFLWDPLPPATYIPQNNNYSHSLHEPGLLTQNSYEFTGNNGMYSTPVLNNSTVSSSKFIKHTISRNTIGPIAPNGTRFSYVGRPYGNDIVGHEGPNVNPLLRSGDAVYNVNDVNNTNIEGGVISRGVTTTTTRRRVNVTRTVYSYPDPTGGPRALSSNYLSPSEYRKIRRKFFSRTRENNDLSKADPDFVSAYAFTGGETEYADGHEFSEPVVATITVNQARALRRQWRRKRHHMLQEKDASGGRKLKKRLRRRQGKKMLRKGLRKRPGMKRTTTEQPILPEAK